ncbi:thioredoxin-dependent thiol peroxidase [Sedimenticola selenatireducens]|jgi:peroxiredoxin Q/BCP|uniref:thioredoxin-dependent peroxiredoxin n=1 Tax=Sedimenticola selenatireducens TaxID=191960 RepID=A0A558DQ51_9GAMM|nr:thioredoxin-dependent thiol peroxidase [Sedimenticola selenatireducens]TVO70555.1 thioredoxin-dependent thiol peroxidase [Sedimenticola selenatireducens]TVT63132.1 MAG: thioredoxin-dependent thiol peroxidase [Sedimenticola selenatireducens]
MNFPSINKKAPGFTLLNQNGEQVSLKDFLGKNVVIYFYPKASTPGCTVQACGIRDSRKRFDELNTVVLGISPDVPGKLTNFTSKQNLNFTLLSDPDHSVADAYGVWGPKKFMGRIYDGIHRISFIIDKKGTLRHIMDKVKTKTHHDDVITYIKENLSAG